MQTSDNSPDTNYITQGQRDKTSLPFCRSAFLPFRLFLTQRRRDAAWTFPFFRAKTQRFKETRLYSGFAFSFSTFLPFHLSAFLPFCLFCLLFTSCAEDYYVYGIEDVEITPVNSEKDKAKTPSQYISILYSNMFQKAIGPNQMLQAQKAIESIGDKQVAYDILVSKYMNDPDVKIPTNESMREDPETFVRDTYTRFLVRQPTEAELQWMINYIESRPALTTELVYFSFATSNEHFHY